MKAIYLIIFLSSCQPIFYSQRVVYFEKDENGNDQKEMSSFKRWKRGSDNFMKRRKTLFCYDKKGNIKSKFFTKEFRDMSITRVKLLRGTFKEYGQKGKIIRRKNLKVRKGEVNK